MCEGRFAVPVRIISLISIYVALLMSVSAQIQCETYDDDTSLGFHWSAASGSVHHYNVYLSTDGAEYLTVGTASTAPTQASPYVVPIDAEDGKTYQLKVEAEDANGTTGPMSDPSDPVCCKLRSPGDASGQTAGDANGNLRVGPGDWSILCKAWSTQRGTASFDYRADLNYNDLVDILDIAVFRVNWGNTYGGTGAPVLDAPLASKDGNAARRSRTRLRLNGQENLRVGDEVSIDIVIEEAEDIYAMDFEVSFDPALVKIEGIEQGTFFSSAAGDSGQMNDLRRAERSVPSSWIAGEIGQNHGRISPTLTAVPLGSSTGRGGNGVIAMLNLTAISGGASSISLRSIHAYDSKLNAIAVTPVSAALAIEASKNLLAQNYPNPFNPETWIPYALAEECDRVAITIHSVLGEEIRRLELGPKSAGFYTTEDRAAYWDGKNEDGINVASGVYFYQIKAGGFSAVRKMVVLK